MTSYGLALAPGSEVPGAGKQGVVVTEIDPDGVAAQKGLKVGDVILEAGGKTVGQPSDIVSVIGDAKKEGRKADPAARQEWRRHPFIAWRSRSRRDLTAAAQLPAAVEPWGAVFVLSR